MYHINPYKTKTGWLLFHVPYKPLQNKDAIHEEQNRRNNAQPNKSSIGSTRCHYTITQSCFSFSMYRLEKQETHLCFLPKEEEREDQKEKNTTH